MSITTFIAVFLFFISFLTGVQVSRATKFNAVLPAFILGLIACLIRSLAGGPLVPLAIAAVTMLHFAAGYLTAWLMGRNTTVNWF